MKILVIDDDNGIRAMLREWLQEIYSCEVAEYDSGNGALEVIKSEAPDLLLLDIMLSQQNGLKLLKTIKALNPYLPVILFSAYGSKSFLEKAINLGADGFISKPPDFKSVKVKIDSSLQKYQLIRENIKLKEQYQKSEQKYRELVENSRDGVFRLDENERIVYVNKKMLEWVEIPFDELIGYKFGDLDLLDTKEYLKKKSTTGFLYEMAITSKSGEKYILEVSSTWLKKDGEVIGTEGIARDITSRKKLEKKLEKQNIHLHSIINSIAEGILAYDDLGKIIACNKSLRMIIGNLDAKIIGLDYEIFLQKYSYLIEANSFIKELKERVNKNPFEFINIEFILKKNKKIYNCSAYPMLDKSGKIHGRVLVFHDITKRKLTEKMREDLSSMLVHDLKNPLAAMIMYADILMGEIECDKHRNLLEKIHLTTQDLSTMVMSLLDVHKMEEEKMELERDYFYLSDPLQRAYNHIEVMKDLKKINVKLDLQENLPLIWADEERIYRVIINLVGNALTHTPKAGEINIRAWADSSQRNLFFSISDSGTGIPKEYQNTIFDKFVQVKSRKEGKKLSSGLGLTYCKLAVETHGGEIWLDSEEGKGATFVVRLPVSIKK